MLVESVVDEENIEETQVPLMEQIHWGDPVIKGGGGLTGKYFL